MAANISTAELPFIPPTLLDASIFLRPSSIFISVITIGLFAVLSWKGLAGENLKWGLGEVIGKEGDHDFHKALYDGYFKVRHNGHCAPYPKQGE
jgi:hypothetical protein